MTEIIKIESSLPAAPNRADEILDTFLKEAQILDSSKLRYKKSLTMFFNWLAAENIMLANVTLIELNAYKKYLEEKKTPKGQNLSISSINSYLNGVKVFYNWAEATNRVMRNPARLLKTEKVDVKFHREPIPAEKCLFLIEYLIKQSPRDFAIANLIILTGLRTVEVARANVGDIDVRDGERVLFVQGKGRKAKDKWVKLLEESFVPIAEYLKTRTNLQSSDPLFASESTNNKGGRLIPGTISEMIKAALRAIGLDNSKWTAHSLRHSAGSWAYAAGASIEQIQEMLRHASPTTTAIYIRMAQERKRLHERSAENILVDFYKNLRKGPQSG